MPQLADETSHSRVVVNTMPSVPSKEKRANRKRPSIMRTLWLGRHSSCHSQLFSRSSERISQFHGLTCPLLVAMAQPISLSIRDLSFQLVAFVASAVEKQVCQHWRGRLLVQKTLLMQPPNNQTPALKL